MASNRLKVKKSPTAVRDLLKQHGLYCSSAVLLQGHIAEVCVSQASTLFLLLSFYPPFGITQKRAAGNVLILLRCPVISCALSAKELANLIMRASGAEVLDTCLAEANKNVAISRAGQPT